MLEKSTGFHPERLGMTWKYRGIHWIHWIHIFGEKQHEKKHHVFKFTLPELSHCQVRYVRDRLAPNKAIRTHIEGESTSGHPQDTERREIPHKYGGVQDKNHENQLELQLG